MSNRIDEIEQNNSNGSAGQVGSDNEQTIIHNNSCPPGRCWQRGGIKWGKKTEVIQLIVYLTILALFVKWLLT